MPNQTNTRTNTGIRLDDLYYVAMKHIKLAIGFAVIGLVVGMLVSFAMYIKGLTNVTYKIAASIAVTSVKEDGLFASDSSDPNSSDIHLAEDMTDAVIYVIKSDNTLNAAAEKLQLIGVTADDIKPKLSLSQYEDTQIIEMTLNWDNAEEGKLILEAITEVVPDILIDTLKIGNVSVVNPPKVKISSSSFLNLKIVAMCVAGGFAACLAFFILKFFIHPTFLHSEDVKSTCNLDILGEIPKDKVYFDQKINGPNANDFSPMQEHFTSLAHALVYNLKSLEHSVIYITSTTAQEGKSSITANLGYALAELGYKTLVIDFDVRNPSLSSKYVFNWDDEHCFNAVYQGEVKPMEAVVCIEDNLDILPTKLSDSKVKIDEIALDFIKEAKRHYDYVLIDTAPIGMVSDAMNLNSAVDCALFLIRQDYAWTNTVSESVIKLRRSGISILGAIMNDTKGGANAYYYSYYGAYGYGNRGNSPYLPKNNSSRSKSSRKAKHNNNAEPKKSKLELDIMRKRQDEGDEKFNQLLANFNDTSIKTPDIDKIAETNNDNDDYDSPIDFSDPRR